MIFLFFPFFFFLDPLFRDKLEYQIPYINLVLPRFSGLYLSLLLVLTMRIGMLAFCLLILS